MSHDPPSAPPLHERVARVEERVDVLTDDVASLQAAFRILVEEAAREGRPISARAVQLAIRHGETIPMAIAAAPSAPPKNTRTRRGGEALPGAVRTKAMRLRRRIADLEAAGDPVHAAEVRAELAQLLDRNAHDAIVSSTRSTTSSSPLETPGAAGEPVTVTRDETGNVTPEASQRHKNCDVSGNVTANVTGFVTAGPTTRPSEAFSGISSEKPSETSLDLALSASSSLSGDNVTRLPARAHAPARSGAREAVSLGSAPPAADNAPAGSALVEPSPSAAGDGERRDSGKRSDVRIWTIVGQCADAWRQERRIAYENGLHGDEGDLEPPPFAPPTRKGNSGARCAIYDGCKRADNLLRDANIPRKSGDRFVRSELVVLAFRLFAGRPRVLWKDWRDEARSWVEVALARHRGDARAPLPKPREASGDARPQKRANGVQPSFARPGF